MDLMRKVLLEVRAGKSCFEPVGATREALVQFQAVAKRMKEAHEQQLIREAHFRQSYTQDTHGWYLTVLANGGLTLKGNQWLETTPSRKESEFRKRLRDNAAQVSVGVISTVIAALIVAAWGIR